MTRRCLRAARSIPPGGRHAHRERRVTVPRVFTAGKHTRSGHPGDFAEPATTDSRGVIACSRYEDCVARQYSSSSQAR